MGAQGVLPREGLSTHVTLVLWQSKMSSVNVNFEADMPFESPLPAEGLAAFDVEGAPQPEGFAAELMSFFFRCTVLW